MTHSVIFSQSLIRLCGNKMSVGLVFRGLDVRAFIQRCKVPLLLTFHEVILFFRNLEGVPTKLRIGSMCPGGQN